MSVIELCDVSKSVHWGDESIGIMNDFSLNVNADEHLAIVGPSGSGKTTLLNIITGMDQADSGKVRVFGQDLSSMSEEARVDFRAQHIGMVFQDFCLFSGLSVLENVSLLVPPEQRDACHEMIKAVGLGHRESVLAGYLSGGERQRVAIARAMVKRPSLLVADEPTAQLDRRTAAQVMDLFFKLGNVYSKAIVLVTHDPQVAKRCDTTVMMGAD